jgi:hypothetical protein
LHCDGSLDGKTVPAALLAIATAVILHCTYTQHNIIAQACRAVSLGYFCHLSALHNKISFIFPISKGTVPRKFIRAKGLVEKRLELLPSFHFSALLWVGAEF